MDQARRRLSLAAVLEDENSNDEENANYEYSLFNYKPRFCDMKSPLSASVNKINSANDYVTSIRSRSSSSVLISNSFTSLTSSVVDVEELENYVIPRDVKKLRSRTKSFSPGSGVTVTKYDMIKQKYQSRQNTAKSRMTSSSLSTASSSSSVSSSSPRSSSINESEAETETFWNRYKRQSNNKKVKSFGKIIKRAFSMNVKTRPVIRKSFDLEKDDDSPTPSTPIDEAFYDDLYTETYQELYTSGNEFNQSQSKITKKKSKRNPKPLTHRSVSEMIL